MTKLKILIFPYYKEIFITVRRKECERLNKLINRCRTDWNSDLNYIPDSGFLGFEIYFDNSIQMYVNEENIFYTDENITQLLVDPNKKINDLLLEIAMKKYYKELNYFFEVRRYNKKNVSKKEKSV